MGTIKAQGNFALHWREAKSITAPCSGRVEEIFDLSDLDLSQPRKPKLVMKYTSPELLAEQSSYLQSRSGHTRNRLLQMGLSENGLDWIIKNKRPVRYHRVYVPFSDYVQSVLSLGTVFEKGIDLLKHGKIYAECQVNEEATAHIVPSSSCIVVPKEWNNEQYNGRIIDARRVNYPPDAWAYLIQIDGKVRPYPLHTNLDILINAPSVTSTLEGSRFTVAPTVKHLLQTNIYDERLSRRDPPEKIRERKQRESEAKENARPRFPVVSPSGFKPEPSPSRTFKRKNIEDPLLLSKREWDLARLEMVRIEKRAFHHRYECSAWVMPWNKLRLPPPPDVMNLHPEEMISGDYRKLLYLKLQIPSEDFLKFEGPIKVTIHNPAGANVSFTTEPYGAEEVRDCCHAFGLRLLSNVVYTPERYDRTVLLEGTETKEVLCLPDTCLTHPSSGKKVAVHVGKYQLADIDVAVGRHKGGYTEILKGVEAGEVVCLNHLATYKMIKEVKGRVREELANDIRIAVRSAYSKSSR